MSCPWPKRVLSFSASIYETPVDKIDLIPHGIPDVPFADPNYYKDKFGVEGRPVLLTFGLLSSKKGIENVLNALPAIVRDFPNVVYISTKTGCLTAFWPRFSGNDPHPRIAWRQVSSNSPGGCSSAAPSFLCSPLATKRSMPAPSRDGQGRMIRLRSLGMGCLPHRVTYRFGGKCGVLKANEFALAKHSTIFRPGAVGLLFPRATSNREKRGGATHRASTSSHSESTIREGR